MPVATGFSHLRRRRTMPCPRCSGTTTNNQYAAITIVNTPTKLPMMYRFKSTTSRNHFHVLEHRGGQRFTRRQDPIRALGSDPGGSEQSLHAPVLADPGSLEEEYFLRRDHIAFHAGQLSDACYLSPPVRQPRDVDDQVDRRRDLLADGALGDVQARH